LKTWLSVAMFFDTTSADLNTIGFRPTVFNIGPRSELPPCKVCVKACGELKNGMPCRNDWAMVTTLKNREVWAGSLHTALSGATSVPQISARSVCALAVFTLTL